jgi:hypothetical protein
MVVWCVTPSLTRVCVACHLSHAAYSSVCPYAAILWVWWRARTRHGRRHKPSIPLALQLLSEHLHGRLQNGGRQGRWLDYFGGAGRPSQFLGFGVPHRRTRCLGPKMWQILTEFIKIVDFIRSRKKTVDFIRFGRLHCAGRSSCR